MPAHSVKLTPFSSPAYAAFKPWGAIVSQSSSLTCPLNGVLVYRQLNPMEAIPTGLDLLPAQAEAVDAPSPPEPQQLLVTLEAFVGLMAEVVAAGRGIPRAYLLPSPVAKQPDMDLTFHPEISKRSKVSQCCLRNLWCRTTSMISKAVECSSKSFLPNMWQGSSPAHHSNAQVLTFQFLLLRSICRIDISNG